MNYLWMLNVDLFFTNISKSSFSKITKFHCRRKKKLRNNPEPDNQINVILISSTTENSEQSKKQVDEIKIQS